MIASIETIRTTILELLHVAGSRKPGTIAECAGSRSPPKKPRGSAASVNTKFARTVLATRRQRIPTTR